MSQGNADDGFGTPSTGGGREWWKNFTLEAPNERKGESETVFEARLIPPIKSLKDRGFWKMWFSQHFGYAGVNPKNPDKPKMRPFGCIQEKDRDTGMITITCDECNYIQEKVDAKERVLAEAKVNGRDPEETESAVAPYNMFLSKHNRSGKFFINVMNRSGEFGTLQVTMTCMKEELEPLRLKLLNDRKINIMDVNKGVWLRFTTTGWGLKKTTKISVVTETHIVGDDVMEKIAYAPMTDDQKRRALEVCPDLAKDVVKFLSATQIKQLVQCSGDPEEVDRIWAQGEKKKPVIPVTNHKPVTSVEMATEVVVTKFKSETTEPTTDVVPTKTVAQPVVTIPLPADPMKMTEADFLAKYGISS